MITAKSSFASFAVNKSVIKTLYVTRCRPNLGMQENGTVKPHHVKVSLTQRPRGGIEVYAEAERSGK